MYCYHWKIQSNILGTHALDHIVLKYICTLIKKLVLQVTMIGVIMIKVNCKNYLKSKTLSIFSLYIQPEPNPFRPLGKAGKVQDRACSLGHRFCLGMCWGIKGDFTKGTDAHYLGGTERKPTMKTPEREIRRQVCFSLWSRQKGGLLWNILIEKDSQHSSLELLNQNLNLICFNL